MQFERVFMKLMERDLFVSERGNQRKSVPGFTENSTGTLGPEQPARAQHCWTLKALATNLLAQEPSKPRTTFKPSSSIIILHLYLVMAPLTNSPVTFSSMINHYDIYFEFADSKSMLSPKVNI